MKLIHPVAKWMPTSSQLQELLFKGTPLKSQETSLLGCAVDQNPEELMFIGVKFFICVHLCSSAANIANA
jgi:hypothetical protein